MFRAHTKMMVLMELNKSDSSGYDLMKSMNTYGEKPSPGYLYPLLADLEKNKFISLKENGRQKIYSITKKGKTLLEDLRKSRQEMFHKTATIISTMTNKSELDEFKQMKKMIIEKHKNFKDEGILAKFHRTLFSTYEKTDKSKNEKIKLILADAIKKLEELK